MGTDDSNNNQSSGNEIKEWFLPNREGDEPLGPYSSAEVESLLRKGEIRVDEYIYGSHFDETRWERIQDLSEFRDAVIAYPKAKLPKKHSKGLSQKKKTSSSLKLDFSSEGEFGVLNIYRRFPRAPFEAQAIIHNGKRYCKAQCVDISERGVFVHLDRKDLFEKGEEVTITIRDQEGMGTFSASSVVMRVKEKDTTPGIGVVFLRINPQIKRKIARYVLGALQDKAPSKDSEVA